MNEEELILMQIEIRETTDLLAYSINQHLPLTPLGIDYLIERIRVLKKTLADMEADLFRELQRQIQAN